jgi:predicted O-methyltransferase YrrM
MIPFQLHRRIPFVRRPFFQRDQAMAEKRRLSQENSDLRAELAFAAREPPEEPRLDAIPIEELASAFASRIRDLPGNQFHGLFDAAGYHLLRKHFYVPVPELADIQPSAWTTPSPLAGLDMNEDAAHELMDIILPPFLAEFRARFPVQASPDKGFHLINGSYMAVDAHLLYGIVRHAKPRRIIEIGNGASTVIAVAAADLNRAEGHPVEVSSIDPYPTAAFANGYPGLSELIVKKVQDVPGSLFEGLERNDILFIDSSHVLRWGNDVAHLYLNILPMLKDGVLVHIHDISLPMPYPKVYFDLQLYWNEQYLLQAFLMFNRQFKIIWPGNYMMLKDPGKMLAVFPEIADMRAVYPSSEPTAFWMRVTRT